MALERKKTLNVFRDARAAWGSYDDFPVGQPGTDPMPRLSRNRVPQPFWLVSDADTVLVHMSGRAELLMRGAEPLVLAPGDTVYVPARVPSRVVPHGEVIHIRLTPEPGAREAAAWFCACGARVHVEPIAAGVPQAGWWAAVQRWNADAALRTCGACGTVQPPAPLDDLAWPAVAAALADEG